MPSPRIAILGCLATLATACYGDAPAVLHPVPVPPANGGELIVHTEETTHIETTQKRDEVCVGGALALVGADACVGAEYSVDTPITETKSTAALGDIPLSYGQFLVLTDSQYDQKLALLDEHRDACNRSAIPQWTGIGLGAAGLVALGTSEKGSAMQTVGWIGLAAGVATYAAGYLAFGGARCEEGRRLYHRLDHSRYGDTMIVTGPARAREMQSVARQFNMRNRQAQARN